MSADLLSELLSSREREGRFYGLTVGIVTNNKDEEGLGRVKVKFPCLSDGDDSYWARVITPMAGNNRGIYFLPEVDDEVMVAFAHGDIEIPYIVGSVWNGKDKPPETNSDGKNNLRLIKSRSGHEIILDDSKGKEKITIRDKTRKNEVIIDSKGTITFKSSGDMLLETEDSFEIKAGRCNIEAKSKMDIKCRAGVKINGMSLEVM
ncbi:MAG: phage tail protein [Oscillatoria sp. SIO1A7]|nr:phage tail protein [Oscillatoria sp. SIO1A7]